MLKITTIFLFFWQSDYTIFLMENILMVETNLKDDALYNFAVNQEKGVDKVLKKLAESNLVWEQKNRKLW